MTEIGNDLLIHIFNKIRMCEVDEVADVVLKIAIYKSKLSSFLKDDLHFF